MLDEFVSVITPVFNAGKHLPAAIESVLSQTWRDFELFLIDDCSVDDSREIIERYCRVDQRVHSVLLDSNGGPARARNAGIRMASGNFVAFLDADDIWCPGKLDRQLATFRQMPDLGLLGTNAFLLDAEGVRGQRLIPSDRIRWGRVSLADYLLDRVPLATSSVMVRGECLQRCGHFNEVYPTCEDFELWMRIIQHYAVGILDEELIGYRRHEMNISANTIKLRSNKISVFENEVLPRIESLGDRSGAFLRKLQRMHISLGRLLATEGRRAEAEACFDKALHMRGSRLQSLRALYYRTFILFS